MSGSSFGILLLPIRGLLFAVLDLRLNLASRFSVENHSNLLHRVPLGLEKEEVSKDEEDHLESKEEKVVFPR